MSQKKQILEHLKKYGSIAPMAALNEYGCMRLASRIHEIKREGYDVMTFHRSRNGKSWAEYSLTKQGDLFDSNH